VHVQTFKQLTLLAVTVDFRPRPYGRDSIGDSVIAGDLRWGGMYGVNVDFVARSHCSVAIIKLEDMKVARRRMFPL
jgi:hypothetical protein